MTVYWKNHNLKKPPYSKEIKSVVPIDLYFGSMKCLECTKLTGETFIIPLKDFIKIELS